jgi:hypothetical protein
MFRYIRKHHLFASFTSYLFQNIENIHTDLHTIFDMIQKIHVAANILFKANVHLRFSHTGEYLLQNIYLEANNGKTFSKLHIQGNICKYLLENICIQANIRLQIFANQ